MDKENTKDSLNSRYFRMSSREVEREERQNIRRRHNSDESKKVNNRQEKRVVNNMRRNVIDEIFGKPEPQGKIREEETAAAKQRAEEARKLRKNNSVKKEILIDFILDGTYSFTTVFPKVYYMIKNIVEKLDFDASEYRGVCMKYGLTVLHEIAEPIAFEKDVYFTNDSSLFLEEVQNIEFYGGSPDGRENLAEALDAGLRVLNNAEGNVSRGLILFSDSLPKEDKLSPNFFAYDQNGYMNKGLRFALFYTNKDVFTPALRMVDHDEEFVQNGRNEAYFHSLNEILAGDLDSLTIMIQKIVSQTLRQVSVR